MLQNLPDVVGGALRAQRAGTDQLACTLVERPGELSAIELSSPAFADDAALPTEYTADGAGRSPPLQWRGVPAGTVSLVLIVEDADAPTPQPLVHAIAVDLPVHDGGLDEGALGGANDQVTDGVTTGRNSYLQTRWLPPDPPPGDGKHRYHFQLFALAAGAKFSSKPGHDEVLDALRHYAIASGRLIGTYERAEGA